MNQVTTLPTSKPVTGFDLRPTNMNEAMQMATMIAGSQLAPKDFKGKPEDTLVAMMMGNELGLNPMQAIQNIAVINGRPSVWGDALLALVQNHPKFGSIEETFDKTSMTATCIVSRKGGKAHTETFSKEDAEIAGLWGRNTWKQYPKRMLQMRARGFALRNQFADALLGLITAEEAQDFPVDTSTGEIIHTPVIDDKPVELPICTDDHFQTNKDVWRKAIEKNNGNAQGLINKISTKYTLTEDQQNELHSMGVTE